MTEADLSRKMVQALRDRGAWAVKTHGDPRQRRGLPDIVACYRSTFLGLEVKLPGKVRTVTKLQAHTLEAIGRAGGIHRVVTSVEQVEGILHRIDSILNERLQRRSE